MDRFVQFLSSIFTPKSSDDTRRRKFENLWPKFRKYCDAAVEDERKDEWYDIWKVVWSEKASQADKTLALGRYFEMYNDIMQKEDQESHIELEIKALTKQLLLLERAANKSCEDLHIKTSKMTEITDKSHLNNCEQAQLYVSQHLAKQAKIVELGKRKIEDDVKLDARNEEARLKSELDKANVQLNTTAQTKVVLWLRGDQNKISSVPEYLLGIEYRWWSEDSSATVKSSPKNIVNVLLNFYDVQENIVENVKADPEYVSLYTLFEGNCVVVRIERYPKKNLDTTLFDQQVPSSIHNVNTVLEVQILEAQVLDGKIYDLEENFAKSLSEGKDKTRNLHYLLSKLRNNNREQRTLIEKRIQDLETELVS